MLKEEEKVKEERGGKAANARQQQARRPEWCGEEAPEGAAAGGWEQRGGWPGAVVSVAVPSCCGTVGAKTRASVCSVSHETGKMMGREFVDRVFCGTGNGPACPRGP